MNAPDRRHGGGETGTRYVARLRAGNSSGRQGCLRRCVLPTRPYTQAAEDMWDAACNRISVGCSSNGRVSEGEAVAARHYPETQQVPTDLRANCLKCWVL
jgi:hypothetical protein